MKRTATIVTAALAGACAWGQLAPIEPTEGGALPPLVLGEEEQKPADDWKIGVEAMRIMGGFARDALQHRTDVDFSGDNPWSAGNSSSDGYGWHLSASLDDKGVANLTLQSVSTEYELMPEGGEHHITGDRFDGQLDWTQVTDEGDDWRRGWLAGIRVMTEDKRVDIQEHSKTMSLDADSDWKLLIGGYFFDWRPFGRWARVVGNINFLFGDVDGVCREGADEDWGDGAFSEKYITDDSLAYGANAGIALYVDLHPRVSLGIGYRREWLYSFDATDTGMAMYPDNDDAKFIANSDYVTANIVAHF